MDTSKVYFDSEGNECSIWQMVKREPTWAAVRIQEGEKAIDEITTLRQQIADAKEENEQVRQANIHTMDVFEDMKAAKEKAEARVAELEDALVWALGKLSIEVPVTGGNVTYIRAFEKADKALSSNGKAWLLRKQADAVEAALLHIVTAPHPTTAQQAVEQCAQRLRQQADEAERAGGEE